jgi:proton-translocating NAD(P)+ transhydrogenase subunit alpha
VSHPLIAFVPRETTPGETRVAASTDSVKRLVSKGFEVIVEADAGASSRISDADFTAAGAEVRTADAATYGSADLVLKLNPPEARDDLGGTEAALMKEGSLLVSFLWPAANLETVKTLADGGVTSFAMELIPRISRAQSMDALSSQSNLAGYKCALLAADRLGKIMPMLMTAAGTVRPAKVVIMGAGVAGLQAVATARRLGAVVEVSDIRPVVREQVESLGARFIDLPEMDDAEDEGGYAKQVTPEFLAKQQSIVAEHVAVADAVITTALVPGRPAPKLLTRAMVEAMRPGSVIVDMAVEQGGNCELSRPGEIVEHGGVTIIGHLNIPGLVPVHASEMYARNVLHCVEHLTHEDAIHIDFGDEITAGAVVTHAGEVRHGPTAAALDASADAGGDA